MHHQIDVTVPSSAADDVSAELARHGGVLALTRQQDGSVKPPGDVLSVHVLNRSIDDVLAIIERAQEHGPITMATVRTESVVATGAQEAVEDDADESPWEEFERTLRHHGRISTNYLALMALGGAIAVAGLLSPPVPQALALAASAIIAPAFEPVAKLAVAALRGSLYRIRRSLVSVVVGYLVLAAGGGVTFLVMRALGMGAPEMLATSEGVHMVVDPTVADWLVGAGGAIAGLVIITSFREAVLAGALIALALVPAAALVGIGVVSGDWTLALEGLQRTGADMGLVVVLGGAVVLVKDRLHHGGRRPLA
ncbi:DUF389 domain-containing protein [Actinomycetospora straminea]|uniref:Hydrophobic protein (TIGR00271 family) n=1 Tax=Actinomycetospora straminea TaxID=663607 RepID=A0ABP9F9Y4_9PSEU|nr:DUF389 domain-containing protein [Actinomycetospora straminea]MDD7933069.1 DUF389 domain-containing protein [Actinomycetospora straminea]